METNPEQIISNILDDMAEIGDWVSISDAIQANGRKSHQANREDITLILRAIEQSQEIAIGKINGEFQDFPTDWEPAEVTAEIFSDPQPVGAMMQVLLRPAGQWPEKTKP